jgi:hypothetical protein
MLFLLAPLFVPRTKILNVFPSGTIITVAARMYAVNIALTRVDQNSHDVPLALF